MNWQIGDEIIITTTDGHQSQSENEVHTITGLSSDGHTLTLDQNLAYKHLGITETYPRNWIVELRAEVGLLTQNIKIRGNMEDTQGNETTGCDEGFQLGMLYQFPYHSTLVKIRVYSVQLLIICTTSDNNMIFSEARR